jgi:hypothetical protein
MSRGFWVSFAAAALRYGRSKREVAGMRGRILGSLIGAACTALALLPGTALAGTLDQQQPNYDADTQIQSMASEAQIFTAGLTGGLDRVDLLLGGGGLGPTVPLTVEIRDVSGGQPGTTVLATGSVPPSAVSFTDAWIPITLAPAVPVTAGTQYSIVAYSSGDSTHHYLWGIAFFDPYPAGANYFQTASPPGPTWTLSGLNGDHAFKTYVEVPPGPTATGPTGKRASAKRRCKKKFDKGTKKRAKCLKKARKLPV